MTEKVTGHIQGEAVITEAKTLMVSKRRMLKFIPFDDIFVIEYHEPNGYVSNFIVNEELFDKFWKIAMDEKAKKE